MESEESEALLGVLCDAQPHTLHRRYFPSKVGGKPAWLNPRDLPSEKDLLCPKCGQMTTFVMQVYASLEPDQCFHRTIFLFACQACKDQVVAWRSQLPRENEFYGYEPACEEDRSLEDACLDDLCCDLCGLPSSVGRHPLCTKRAEAGIISPTFPQHGLDVEPEDDWEEAGLEHEEELLKRHQQEVGANPEAELDASEAQVFEDAQQDQDEAFQSFEERTFFTNPSQVLRYELGANPVWFSDKNQLASPERCQSCGGPRIFEFQIQPQIIALLKTERLDFGIVAVYTCKHNCEDRATRSAYAKELAYVQPDA